MKHYLLLIVSLALLSQGCTAGAPPDAGETFTPVALNTPAATSDSPGKTLYEATCTACHGADGKGIPTLGKTLVGSPMLKLKDAELVGFIKKGRDVSDPENTTRVAMPPKGGNAALTDADIGQIVTYMRTLK